MPRRHREARLDPHRDITKLYTELVNERSVNRQLETADQMVHGALYENTDALSVMRVIDTAFEILQPNGPVNREVGLQMLNQIENSFLDSQVTTKILIPLKQDVRDELDEIQERLINITSNKDKASRTAWLKQKTSDNPFPTTIDFLVAIQQAFKDNVDTPENLVYQPIEVVALERYYEDDNPGEIDAALETYDQALNVVHALDLKRMNPGDFRSTILPVIRNPFRHQFPAVPDLYTHPLNNTGFRDIAEYQPANNWGVEDQEEIGFQTLNFLANLPEGDFLWNKLSENLLIMPAPADNIDDTTPQESLTFSENVFRFQKWTMEKLLLQTFAPKDDEEVELQASFSHLFHYDQEFDDHFAAMVNNLNLHNTFLLGVMIIQTSLHNTSGVAKYEGIERKKSIESCPLNLLADHRSQGRTGLLVVDEVTRDLLQGNWQTIRANLQARFSNLIEKNKLKLLLECTDQMISLEHGEGLGEELVRHIEANVGGNLIEQLDEKKDQIDQVTEAVNQEVQTVDYWPSPTIAHVIEYSPDSLPEIMGFEAIQFAVGEDQSDPVGLTITLQDQRFSIGGEMEANGEIQWKFPLEEISPGVNSLINFIATASLRDLVVRETIHKELKPRRARRTNLDQGQETKPRGGLPRLAPRRRMIYDKNTPTDTNLLASETLTAEIEEYGARTEGFTPRIVDSFTRNLPGIADYQQAYLGWKHASDQEKAQREEELKRARKFLQQPNPEKVANLPPRFQLEPLIDPEAGEQLLDFKPGRENVPLWTETWVKGFESPKLTKEESASLSVLYQKRYRGGSALAFGQEIKQWIFGIEEKND